MLQKDFFFFFYEPFFPSCLQFTAMSMKKMLAIPPMNREEDSQNQED